MMLRGWVFLSLGVFLVICVLIITGFCGIIGSIEIMGFVRGWGRRLEWFRAKTLRSKDAKVREEKKREEICRGKAQC
jgi:hypothetical protein